MLQIKNLPLKSNSPYFGWKLLSILVIGVMLASIMVSGLFIYTNIYRTLDDVNTIVVLNSDLQLDSINIGAFEKTQNLIMVKNGTSTLPSQLRNIFTVVPTSTLR